MFALVVGTVYERCKTLRYTMLIHFFMNFFTILAYSDSVICVFGKLRVLPGFRKFFLGVHPVLGGVFFVIIVSMIVLLLVMFTKVWKENAVSKSE